MLHYLRQHPYAFCAVMLLASALLCASMLVARIWYTGRPTFQFLAWNLFLAGLPVAFALLLHELSKRQAKGRFLVAVALLWAVFFPNAPYIITDFVHLRPRAGVPLWYDALLLFTFAWVGLLAALVSLRVVHLVLRERLGRRGAWLTVGAVLLASSYAIYLGRVVRRNSWDLLGDPISIGQDLLLHLEGPLRHPRTYGVTFAFFAFLGVAYLSFVAITRLGVRTTESA